MGTAAAVRSRQLSGHLFAQEEALFLLSLVLLRQSQSADPGHALPESRPISGNNGDGDDDNDDDAGDVYAGRQSIGSCTACMEVE